MFELTHGNNDLENLGEPNSKQPIASLKQKIDKIKAGKKPSQIPKVLSDIKINEVCCSMLGKENHRVYMLVIAT
ncbi:hypothetical protein M0R45_029733 [Rubus argutus]|uniref:Uncharacterized protein n=1 Tax=Rubus argutus TaxID=59490 RepID=A0AAW1WB46_RUBAR